jgi:hypothetical protein
MRVQDSSLEVLFPLFHASRDGWLTSTIPQRCDDPPPLAPGAPHVTMPAPNAVRKLCFLLPYSPNLTLIERLWQFVKKQCLYSTSYVDFAAFKTAIAQCLTQTPTPPRAALDSLLTLRFHRFGKTQFLPA